MQTWEGTFLIGQRGTRSLELGPQKRQRSPSSAQQLPEPQHRQRPSVVADMWEARRVLCLPQLHLAKTHQFKEQRKSNLRRWALQVIGRSSTNSTGREPGHKQMWFASNFLASPPACHAQRTVSQNFRLMYTNWRRKTLSNSTLD